MAHLTSEGRRISSCINQPGYGLFRFSDWGSQHGIDSSLPHAWLPHL